MTYGEMLNLEVAKKSCGTSERFLIVPRTTSAPCVVKVSVFLLVLRNTKRLNSHTMFKSSILPV